MNQSKDFRISGYMEGRQCPTVQNWNSVHLDYSAKTPNLSAAPRVDYGFTKSPGQVHRTRTGEPSGEARMPVISAIRIR